MRALIVDDEPLALECALAMIDWAAEGVRHVDTARSAAQAKELLARDGADILLCDIEMPGGSGLELVEWVRRQDITAQVILLTAHGDFSYAQRAVGLGCLGYLLKPIDPEELRESLRGAIQIVRQQRSYARYREDSERWLRNKPVMAELFWQKLAQAPVPPGPEELAALQERCGTDYPDAAAVFPLLCRVLTGSSQEDGEQVKREISAALFSLCDEIVFLPLSGGALPALCIGKGGLDASQFRPRAEEISRLCAAMHGIRLAVFLDRPCRPGQVRAALDRLELLDRENIWGTAGVFAAGEQPDQPGGQSGPNLQLWTRLMLDGDSRAFLIELDRYREGLRFSSGLGAAFLSQLQHDFLQAVYFVLYTKGIQIHQVFEDGGLLARPPAQLGTVELMFQWISQVAEQTCRALRADAQSGSIAEQVLDDINRHLSQTMYRDELAKRLHVSPDHLTRTVKRATGLTLSEYIQAQRVELAKQLLCCTRKKVSEIALSVGYPHFSQFSTLFKKHTGMTPQAYRAKHGKNVPQS